MLQPLFQTKENEDSDEEMEEEDGHQQMTLELHETAVLALGRAFPLNPATQSKSNSNLS